MAQVVQQYVTHAFKKCEVIALMSTRGKRDWASPLLWLAALMRLTQLRFSRRKTVAVFHISQGGSMVREGTLAWFAKEILGLHTIMHIHGSQFVDFGNKHTRLARFALSHADRVLTLTSETSDAAKLLVPPETPVSMVRNAVSNARYQVPKENIILFAGEVGYRKGIDTLLTAWTMLQDSTRNWELLVAGPIKLDEDTLCVKGVQILGPLNGDTVKKLEARASIAVLPSRDEALPMFLIEAMAHGCAVIGTDVGQVAELLDGAGILIEPDSPEQLARALLGLMEDDRERAALGKSALEKFQRNYSMTTIADDLVAEWLSAERNGAAPQEKVPGEIG
ncbi:glycosyltransferase family 4 protein [Gordonia amicalis]|uniref:glycosyltransferase family 4 protein n=1 Tax=Gordonia amicalis TaxID=89053 RepID=UPI0015F76CEE|nr:glycosyltransferase family 4 protein [Gordonia amicalis]MBA5847039.1 glycosyltransferase family 4 protein [Gordonia amicalis]